MADFKGLWIPIEILSDRDLTANEKLVTAEIYALQPCTASNEYLGNLLNLNRRQIMRIIKSLEEKGWIKTIYFSPVQREINSTKNVTSDKIGTTKNVTTKNVTQYQKCHLTSDKIGTSTTKNVTSTSDKIGKTSTKNVTQEYIENIDKNIVENIKENIGAKPKPKKEFVPPTRTEVFNYVSEKIAEGHSEYKAIDVDKFFNYYSEGNWHMSNGKKVKSWKQCLVTWAGKQWDRPVNRQETPTDRVSRMLNNIFSEEVTE